MACVSGCVCAHVQQPPRIHTSTGCDTAPTLCPPLCYTLVSKRPPEFSPSDKLARAVNAIAASCAQGAWGALGPLLRPLSTNNPEIEIARCPSFRSISASGSCIPQSQSQSQSIKSTLISTLPSSRQLFSSMLRYASCIKRKKGVSNSSHQLLAPNRSKIMSVAANPIQSHLTSLYSSIVSICSVGVRTCSFCLAHSSVISSRTPRHHCCSAASNPFHASASPP
jgi:hypothetical protein